MIFESLRKSVNEKYNIVPYREAYIRLLEKMDHSKLNMPDTKKGQNRNIGSDFLCFFEEEIQRKMIKLLNAGKYIPQECVNYEDMRALM